MEDNSKNKVDWWWHAPEYFSRWRLFPRAFITMYIYFLYEVTTWFMAGLVSVVVGAGAAWFGLYVNSVSSSGKSKTSPVTKAKETAEKPVVK
mgnify:CR=1 FL=1